MFCCLKIGLIQRDITTAKFQAQFKYFSVLGITLQKKYISKVNMNTFTSALNAAS